MMARLLHPSDYKNSTKNVPMPLLVLQAHCCQLCWYGTFSMFLDTAYGLVIIIKHQVCIVPSVLAIPMNLLPQSVAEKLCSPRSPWYLIYDA